MFLGIGVHEQCSDLCTCEGSIGVLGTPVQSEMDRAGLGTRGGIRIFSDRSRGKVAESTLQDFVETSSVLKYAHTKET